MFHLKNELSPALRKSRPLRNGHGRWKRGKENQMACVILINLSKYAHIHVHIPPASKYLIFPCVDRVQDTLPKIWHLWNTEYFKLKKFEKW